MVPGSSSENGVGLAEMAVQVFKPAEKSWNGAGLIGTWFPNFTSRRRNSPGTTRLHAVASVPATTAFENQRAREIYTNTNASVRTGLFDIPMQDLDQTLRGLRFTRAHFCILAQHVKFDLPFHDLHQ
jgi:hypothetical protein